MNTIATRAEDTPLDSADIQPKRWNSMEAIMRREGVSAQELAARIGVHWRTIYAYLSGEIPPTIERIVSLCEALHCTEIELRSDGPVPPVFLTPLSVLKK